MESGEKLPQREIWPFFHLRVPFLVKDDGITVGQEVQLKKYQKSQTEAEK